MTTSTPPGPTPAGLGPGTTGKTGAGVLRRAAGVQLIGEMRGSGYRVAPALARRGDGQTVQLTPLIYAVLSVLDGDRDADEVADLVSTATGRDVTGANVETLVDTLRMQGLAVRADGSEPDLKRSDPLLALRLKVAVTDPERTRRLTDPFARLFHPLVVVPLLAAFAWICWWVLFERGLASATHDAFARPGLLLAVLAITVLSAGFHEFGHAAGARRGGATPGVMGAGVYLVWPAFYTDVTDSYRLGRGGRLRTDLGGLYFNAIVAVATVAVWWLLRDDALLLLVATQILQMARQLLPLVRFDGYHVLADLTGVPDLFQRIGPTLRGLLPWLPSDPRAQALKPWARAVVTAWVLVVVPFFVAALGLLVLTLPRIVGTAVASAGAQRAGALRALGEGDLVAATARGLAMVVVLLPVLAIGYLLVRLGRSLASAAWERTSGRPLRRVLAVLTAGALVAGLGWAWWPQPDRYRPIQAYEGGRLTDLVSLSAPAGGVAVGTEGRGSVVFPAGADLPTRERPQLATVLVPRGGPASASLSPTSPDGVDPADPGAEALVEGEVDQATDGTWIFPFDEPLAPEEGDNQAVAVNTTDGTVTYDVAFALVWADGDLPITTTNEAYAAASCEGCAAVAVAFQVVLVVGEADVVVPQNLSVAVNYDCSSCLTYSLAVQLFVTLDGALSAGAAEQLSGLWEQIAAFGASIGQVPLDQIQGQLSAFEAQILAVIEADQGPLSDPADPSGTATEPSDPEASGTDDASDAPSPTEAASPSGTAPTDPTAPPASPEPGTSTTSTPSSPTSSTPSPTPTPSTTPSTTPSPSPSASASPSPSTASGSTPSATPGS